MGLVPKESHCINLGRPTVRVAFVYADLVKGRVGRFPDAQTACNDATQKLTRSPNDPTHLKSSDRYIVNTISARIL